MPFAPDQRKRSVVRLPSAPDLRSTPSCRPHTGIGSNMSDPRSDRRDTSNTRPFPEGKGSSRSHRPLCEYGQAVLATYKVRFASTGVLRVRRMSGSAYGSSAGAGPRPIPRHVTPARHRGQRADPTDSATGEKGKGQNDKKCRGVDPSVLPASAPPQNSDPAHSAKS